MTGSRVGQRRETCRVGTTGVMDILAQVTHASQMLECIGGRMLRWAEWMSRDRDAVSNSIALCSRSSVLWAVLTLAKTTVLFSGTGIKTHAKTTVMCCVFFPECTCTNQTLKVRPPLQDTSANKSGGGGDVLIRWKNWQRKWLNFVCEPTKNTSVPCSHTSRLVCHFRSILITKNVNITIMQGNLKSITTLQYKV